MQIQRQENNPTVQKLAQLLTVIIPIHHACMSPKALKLLNNKLQRSTG